MAEHGVANAGENKDDLQVQKYQGTLRNAYSIIRHLKKHPE